MIRIRSRWLALVLLPAAACGVDEKPEVQVQPDRGSAPIPAMPVIPAASRAPTGPIAMTPLVPPGGRSPTADEVRDSAAPPKSERELRVEAIATEYGDAMNAYYDLFRAAQTDEERQKLAETTSAPDSGPFRQRMQAVVSEDPSDTAAFDALVWLLNRRAPTDDITADLKLLEDRHFARAEMTNALMALQYANVPAAQALLDRLARESPHRNVRGRALLAQAEALREEAGMIARVRATTEEQERAQLVGYLGADEVARFAHLDPADTEARAIQLYEAVARDYADVPAARQGVIGDSARANVHEMKNLAVGKPAPDIAGEDIQGVAFKLSDYRGQVVMLDFWGHW